MHLLHYDLLSVLDIDSGGAGLSAELATLQVVPSGTSPLASGRGGGGEAYPRCVVNVAVAVELISREVSYVASLFSILRPDELHLIN